MFCVNKSVMCWRQPFGNFMMTILSLNDSILCIFRIWMVTGHHTPMLQYLRTRPGHQFYRLVSTLVMINLPYFLVVLNFSMKTEDRYRYMWKWMSYKQLIRSPWLHVIILPIFYLDQLIYFFSSWWWVVSN